MTQNADASSPDPIATLLRLVTTDPSPQDCRTCQSELDGYVAAQIAGEAYQREFPQVAQHLDQCVDCAEAYAALYELALAEQAGALPVAGDARPDLSFLAPAPPPAERLRGALVHSAERLALQLDALLLPLLRPAAPALAVRAPADERFGETLLALDPEEQPGLETFPLGLTVYRDAQQPDFCLLEVLVQPPDREWPALAGMTVTLDGLAPPRSAQTDAWGLAVFEDVPIAALPDLRIECALAA